MDTRTNTSTNKSYSYDENGVYAIYGNVKYSPREVAREIYNHSLDPNDFFDEIGTREFYRGRVVLEWLGY